MPYREERQDILRMVEEGALEVEQAARLIAALAPPARPAAPAPDDRRRLHLIVTDTATGRPLITAEISLGIAEIALRLGARCLSADRLADLDEIIEAVRTGRSGRLLDLHHSREGVRIEATVE